jgi:hypothetical protein
LQKLETDMAEKKKHLRESEAGHGQADGAADALRTMKMYEAVEEGDGWSVRDRWTGETAIVGSEQQSGLSKTMATATAAGLNAFQKRGPGNSI